MGRKWTDEQKAAASKARLAALKNKNPEQKEPQIDSVIESAIALDEAMAETKSQFLPEQRDPMSGPQPGRTPDMQNVDVGELIRRIQELERNQFFGGQQPPQQQGPQMNRQGALVGTYDKYLIDPANYPDPCTRLADEPRLRRFAFKDNYELDFTVSISSYQTQAGVNTREPKFTLELNRIVYDEETGDPTNGRYTICRAIFHEDPEAALVVAHDNGLDVSGADEKTFLDEMRYLRMRDWLFEAFYAPRPQEKTKKKEMVIGNRVVDFFEINSETSETMPFSQLKKKL